MPALISPLWDDLDIPAFLLVKNRRPLTEEQKRAAARMARAKVREAKRNWDRPPTWSPEAEKLLAEINAAKRKKTKERLDALRERTPRAPRKPTHRAPRRKQ